MLRNLFLKAALPVATLVLAVGCSGRFRQATSEAPSVPESPQPSQISQNTYPAQAVEKFMGKCKSKQPEATCKCFVEKIQANYSPQEFKKILDERQSTGKFPTEVRDRLKGCASKPI